MHTSPILIELVDGQARLASLHILDVTVAAAAGENDLASRKLAPVTGARTFRKIAVVLRRVSAMTRVARNPCVRVNILLPQLANPVFGRQVTLQALSARKIISPGISPGVSPDINPGVNPGVSPGVSCERDTRQNESWYEDFHHATCPR
jgi:hypothetical protein